MKKLITLFLIATGAAGAFAETKFAQDRDVFVHKANYDKSKIPPYTLEVFTCWIYARSGFAQCWPQAPLVDRL